MTKKRLVILGVILILVFFSFNKFLKDSNENEIKGSDLLKYQNVVDVINNGVQRYLNDEEALPEDVFKTLIIEGYANIEIINPWEENNERKNYEYKLIKDNKGNIRAFLINKANKKYIDPRTGEILNLKELPDAKIIE